MGDYAIQIGATDGYRYIGVKPPLDESLKRRVFDELGEAIEDHAISSNQAFSTIVTDSESVYSELGLATMTLEAHRTSVAKLSRKIADVIRSNDHTVVIDSELKHLDGGHDLFEKRR